MADSYACSICGERHNEVPLSWGPDVPDLWARLSEDEREAKGEIGTDQCVINEQHFFVRGRIEIPVQDRHDPFAWLVWVEVTRDVFVAMAKVWTMEGRENTEPLYDGALANDLSLYPTPTLGLPAKLHTRPVGVRPFIEITAEHQIRHEQRTGITFHQVNEIANKLLGC